MIYKGFVTVSVVFAKITVDKYSKVVCKIFDFGTTLNALVNSPMTSYGDKKLIKYTVRTKILMIYEPKTRYFKSITFNRHL